MTMGVAGDPQRQDRSGAMVFAPSPDLTVTLERLDAGDEMHLHPGGQGFWIARLLHVLGVETVICGSFGGEIGAVVQSLLATWGPSSEAVPVRASNGGYVHDRREGQRRFVGGQDPAPLSRHDLDDLYSATLAAGLASSICVLGGPHPTAPSVPADMYRRLASDLMSNGVPVVADLSGEQQAAVLQGGVAVLKTSEEDLIHDGRLGSGASDDDLVAVMRDLGAGAETVVVTRQDRPAVVVRGDVVWLATGPTVEAIDPSGAGDSLTAGMAAGLAEGQSFEGALRLGMAAATLNVTRRGLASGAADAIRSLAPQVEIDILTTKGGGR